MAYHPNNSMPATGLTALGLRTLAEGQPGPILGRTAEERPFTSGRSWRNRIAHPARDNANADRRIPIHRYGSSWLSSHFDLSKQRLGRTRSDSPIPRRAIYRYIWSKPWHQIRARSFIVHGACQCLIVATTPNPKASTNDADLFWLTRPCSTVPGAAHGYYPYRTQTWLDEAQVSKL